MEELDNRYKNDGFKVPDKYFEKLESGLSDQLYPRKNKWQMYFGKAISIAASVTIVICIGILSYKSTQTKEKEISFSDLDSMDIVNYTSSIDISDEELEDLVPEQVIDSLYQVEIIHEQVSNDIPEEEINDLEEEYDFLEI